jgi:hypothetical protein
MAHDSAREVRSMILLSMPCPPMPMLMSKEVQDQVESVGCNSHDLLAHLLNKATAANSCGIELHPKRKVLQVEAHKLLCQRFDEWQAENQDLEVPPLETSYSFFAEFTRAYIHSYMEDPTRQLDIRFEPANYVGSNTEVHIRTRDFAKAQEVLFGAQVSTGRSVDAMAYPEFVQLSARRILQADHQPSI